MMAPGPGLSGRPEGEGVPGHEHASFLGECGSYPENLSPRLRGSRGEILVTPIACTGSRFAVTGGNDGALMVAHPPPHINPLVLVGGK
jgi:hypothetical protein